MYQYLEISINFTSDRTNELKQIFQQRMQEIRPSTNIPTVNEIPEGEDQPKDERNAEEVSFELSLTQEDFDTYRSELAMASLFTSLLLGHTAASTLGIPLYQSLRQVYVSRNNDVSGNDMLKV